MKKVVLLLIFAANATFAQMQNGCDWIDESATIAAGNRLRQLLREKQFSAIEDEINDKMRRIDTGEFSDLALRRSISTAMKADAALEPLLSQWSNERPHSFAARISKAAFYVDTGLVKRGSGFADRTSTEQMDAMQVELKKAALELAEAKRLKPNSALVHAQMIHLARVTVGSEAVQDLLIESERVLPKNLLTRLASLTGLTPKWGGSFAALDSMLDRAEKKGMSADNLRYLQHSVEIQKADHFNVVTKERTKAVAHWRKAAALCPKAEAVWSSIWRYTEEIEDWKALKEASDQYLSSNQVAGTVVQRRGYAFEKMGQNELAVKDYERATQMGEAWAQARLGYFYMVGSLVPKDLSKARQMLEAAATKGIKQAQVNLDWLNRQTQKP